MQGVSTQQTMYDKVGKYDQDQVNGFDTQFIDEFIDLCQIKKNEKILDAMAGDGNLSQRLLQLYPNIDLTTTDICETQCEIARVKLAGRSRVMALNLLGNHPFENEFDVIIVKSANHEIPKKSQRALYASLFKSLKPGGRFINLGILLPDEELRSEIDRLNEYRSKLAEVPLDIQNRYFLTNTEYYNFLEDAGFSDICCLKEFHYTIDMGVLSENYFAGDDNKRLIMNGVAAGLMKFRDRNLTESNENWRVKFPGEITLAKKGVNQ